VKVNARVLASTNRDLARMVVEGTFREDLYFRLKVVEVTVPPLRERRSDLPLLIEQLTREWAARLGKEITGLDSATLNILLNYPYPGNVRELKNILEHAVLLGRDEVLHRDDLPRYLFEHAPARRAAPAALRERERELLLEALLAHRWKIQDTARPCTSPA
jgi:DNA-binding NtrC family response regulator